jgi:hypothetical protein
MKTPASKIAAIRKWQAANKHKVKLAHNRYEQANRAKRNAQRAEYARRKALPGGKARQLEGLRKLRERDKRKLEAF